MESFPTGITILKAVVVGRWLAWAWMAGIMAFTAPDQIRDPLVGWFAVAVTAGLTAASTILVRSSPRRLMRLPFVAAEVGLAIGLSAIDGWVFEPGHVFATTQSIATQWPLIAMATAGVAYGPIIAGSLGLLIGPAELAGALLNDHPTWGTGEIVSIVASSLFFAVLGGVFGWQAQLLRRAEAEIADRRARDEVARVLHDTVLQTLALVERRSSDRDPELASAARQADQDLRAFLFGASGRRSVDLETRVRAQIERVRQGYDIPVLINVLDDGCRLGVTEQELIARALGEAVANSLEHSAAQRVVVFVETDQDGHVLATVNDDGIGFDRSAPRDGHGIDESIIARIESIGGQVEIDSSPGAGTEVLLTSRGASPAGSDRRGTG